MTRARLRNGSYNVPIIVQHMVGCFQHSSYNVPIIVQHMVGCCQHSRGLRLLPCHMHECLAAVGILMRRPCCAALVSCATIRSLHAAAAAARTILPAAGAAAGSVLLAGFRACQPAPAAGETQLSIVEHAFCIQVSILWAKTCASRDLPAMPTVVRRVQLDMQVL